MSIFLPEDNNWRNLEKSGAKIFNTSESNWNHDLYVCPYFTFIIYFVFAFDCIANAH